MHVQAACQAEVDRLAGQLQETVVAAEVGRAKVLLYDELSSKAEKLVSPAYIQAACAVHPGACFCDEQQILLQACLLLLLRRQTACCLLNPDLANC
jgi:hypothetical protein